MAFKNEVVSDADIDRYKLPFQKGEGRWWTRDAERDYYLWGGLSGNPAYDTEQTGKFYLYTNGQTYFIIVHLEELFLRTGQCKHVIKWKTVARIAPEPTSEGEEMRILDIFKQALKTYGLDGQDDNWAKESKMEICF